MSYLVVARKWRPQSFEEVAGQDHITRTLRNAIQSNRIAHAYLFTGVRGVGKTTAARILAKALNCEGGPTPTPCNRCVYCEEITTGRSIDVLEIDGASNRGIDEIRQIIENVRYQPAKCRFKIYIIDEVHQVTKDAFNALLKTLEEPPPSVKFILATTEPHRLPETILSRCQRYDFRRIASREIVERLREVAKNEGLSITDGALVLLAREADGSMRDAQSLLEQILASAGTSRVDEAALQEMLGFAGRRMLYDLSAAVLRGDARRCLELIGSLVSEGRDLCRFSRDLVEHFRNLMVARLLDPSAGSQGGDELLDLPDQEITDLRAQAKGVSLETLLDYFDFMTAGDDEIARSPNPRFALETAVVKLAMLPQSLPLVEVVERLERLEKKLSDRKPPAEFTRTEETHPRPPDRSVGELSAPPARNTQDADKETVWREFVASVRKERKFLASHLDGTQVLELSPERLSLGVGELHELSFLQDAENLASLKSLAKRFFSTNIAVDIKLITPSSTAEEKRSQGGAQAGAPEERTEMVKEALRVFGGSVRSVRREGGQ